MSELAARLRELHASKKPTSGVHGQMMGCEPYILRASGNAFNWLIEAADRLDALEPKCKACGQPWPDYLTAKGPHGCSVADGEVNGS